MPRGLTTGRLLRRYSLLPKTEVGNPPDSDLYEGRDRMLNTPVALSVFNRPDTTASVFQAIARAKPKQLFVFADGPRTAAEAVLCEQARRVVEQVDWACEAEYNYSACNMGARVRYASGVDWVFSHVDDAIILDDDCLPHESFFPF